MRKIILGLAVAVAACAPLTPPPEQGVDYVCAEGGGFRLLTRGAATAIELSGMRFSLQPEPSQDGAERYSCSMLNLTRRDGVAEVEMEGRPYLAGCRPRP